MDFFRMVALVLGVVICVLTVYFAVSGMSV